MRGDKNPNWGKRWSQEQRINASKRLKERWKNPSKAMLEKCGKKPRSQETRKKLSNLAKSRTGTKNPFYGKQHSEELKKRMSIERKGKIPKNAISICIDGKLYRSYNEASRQLGIPAVTVRWRCLSKNKRFSSWITIPPHPSIKAEVAV